MKRYKEIKPVLILCLLILPQVLFCQWVQKANGIGINQAINTLISFNSYIFAGSSTDGVFRSQDFGESWIEVNNGITTKNVSSFLVKGDLLFTGTLGGGIFVSTNYGDSWSAINSGLTNLYVTCFHIKDSIIFVGTSTTQNNSGGVFCSSNYGNNWLFCGLNLLSVKTISSSSVYVLAGTSYNGTSGGVFRTTNSGSNWTDVNAGLGGVSRNANALVTDGANVYLGAGDGVYRSVYYGNNWQTINNNLAPTNVNCLTSYNFNIFIGTQNGVFVTTNYGAIWNIKNQGFSSTPSVLSVLICNNHVFAGTSGQSVWRRNYSELIGVQSITSKIPLRYSLYQNYPNPFNSNSVIKFSIPQNSKYENKNVKLYVYDAEGKLVNILVNEDLKAGEYIVRFDGHNLATGIYYCMLTAGDFSQIQKMVLIK